MTYQLLEAARVEQTEEVVFAGDGVRLSGQIDYPFSSTKRKNFPLLFILHHAGSDDRSGYQHFTDTALDAGYAVFRWDKRGTGRSGAGGRGLTTNDAICAYQVALDQAQVDRRHVVILAQDAGAALLGSSFGLFAREQHPYGVVLATNTLDETTAMAIDSRLLVLMGQHDWNPWQKYAKRVCEAHDRAYDHGACYYVAPYADRMLIDPRSNRFHYGANNSLRDWLHSI